MLLKNLNLLPLAFMIVALFSACARTNYDGGNRIQPFSISEPPPVAKQKQTDTPDTPAVVTPVNLPVVSFVLSEVTINDQLEVQLELQLNEASKLPVTAIINLVNGSALHYRDFAGFKGRSSETARTVVFAPGATRALLPVIGGRHTRFCDSYFFAKINSQYLQNAQVLNNSAKINVLCTLNEEPPPPVDTVSN